ncbi:MAG: hypothetical protein IJQ79_10390 [Bacteroidales bacterium]|nr:hypothetical protein [Bacteroidales bacterium]
MKKKFTQFLSEKIKDMGLSDKAVAELVELGSAGLADNASDDDIKAKVDSVVPFAKAMQGEFTRKVQEAKQSLQQPKRNPKEGEGGDGDEGKGGNGDEIPGWFKAIQKGYDDKIAALETENSTLKAAKAKEEREGKIAAKAKELGIPEFLMKHISLADDADFEKELTEYKQELVNNKLMPADQAGEQGTAEQAMKDAAKSWAESLPNK